MKNNALGPAPTPEVDPGELGAATRVLTALRDAGSSLRIAEIARAVGSHDNTVRGHLATLLEHGLVDTTQAPAAGRGRPALLYSAGPQLGARAGEYRSLAGAFAADLVASGDGPEVRERARGIGGAWGESLRSPSDAAGAHGSEQERLDANLADLGFGPVRDGQVVRLTTCPLLDLAVANPEVICQVHLGLIDGILDRGDAGAEAVLTPFAEPGACVLHVPTRSHA